MTLCSHREMHKFQVDAAAKLAHIHIDNLLPITKRLNKGLSSHSCSLSNLLIRHHAFNPQTTRLCDEDNTPSRLESAPDSPTPCRVRVPKQPDASFLSEGSSLAFQRPERATKATPVAELGADPLLVICERVESRTTRNLCVSATLLQRK